MPIPSSTLYPASSGVYPEANVAPETTILTGPDPLARSSTATFTFESDESGTFEARLDGGAWETVTSPHTVTGLSRGAHTWEVRAIDLDGEPDATPASWVWGAIPPIPHSGPRPVEATVRLQALDGQWETCGVDRLAGITPQGVQLAVNEWGPDRASFTLRRKTGANWPDLVAFTPVDVLVGGMLVWSGRISETPTKDGQDEQVAVQCEGWQYHLDDDVYQANYVHTRLTDWQDARSFVDANLATYVAAYDVSSGDGQILLSAVNEGAAINTIGAVVLDTGDDDGCKRIVVTYKGGGDGSFGLKAVTGSGPLGIAETATLDAAPIATTDTTVSHTFTTARRYIRLELVCTSDAPGYAPNNWVRISAVRVFADTAYESGDESVLKADTVVKSARDTATILLSRSDDKVEAQTFPIPEFHLASYRTPREAIQAINAYEDCQAAVDVDRRVVFREKPAAPVVEIGHWSGSEFEDASANSGDELYNRVVIEGEDPAGDQLVVARESSDLDVASALVSASQPPNAGFEVDTSNWTALEGSLARDTGVFDTGVASGRVTSGTVGSVYRGAVVTAWSPSLTPGKKYRLTVRLRRTSDCVYIVPFVYDGTFLATQYLIGDTLPAADTWTTVSMTFTARNISTLFYVYMYGLTSSTVQGYIDSILTTEPGDTLIDRRNFRRTKILSVASAGDVDSYSQIGDLFLLGHRTTPLRGRLKIDGEGARRVLGGRPVPPHELLLAYGEQVRLTHQVDPDTGALGRDARIASVLYSHDSASAQVDLDSTRGSLEAYLERLAIVTGQI